MPTKGAPAQRTPSRTAATPSRNAVNASPQRGAPAAKPQEGGEEKPAVMSEQLPFDFMSGDVHIYDVRDRSDTKGDATYVYFEWLKDGKTTNTDRDTGAKTEVLHKAGEKAKQAFRDQYYRDVVKQAEIPASYRVRYNKGANGTELSLIPI